MLILVLFLLSGLAVLSVELSRTVLLDHVFSATTRTSLAAKPLLASGEVLAALFLVRRNQLQAQQERQTEGEENPALVGQAFRIFLAQYNAALKRGEILAEIEDENGRLPLAALFPRYSSDDRKAEYVRGMLVRLLTLLLVRHGYEEGPDRARACAEDYVEGLLAWGGETSLSREARVWYLEESGYYPPGRPPESQDELLLVYWPGVDRQLAERTLAGGPAGDGLMQNCSLWSAGPMNINALRRDVAMALPENPLIGMDFALALEQARDSQGEILRTDWHRDIFSSFAVQMPATDVLAQHSRWFRVRLEAGQGASRMRMESVGWLTNTYMEWVARAVH